MHRLLSIALLCSGTSVSTMYISEVFNLIRYTSMATGPWRSAVEFIKNARDEKQERNDAFNNGSYKNVDTKTATLVHDIVGNTTTHIIEDNRHPYIIFSDVDLWSGKQMIIVGSAMLNVLERTNRPLSVQEFNREIRFIAQQDGQRDNIGNNNNTIRRKMFERLRGSLSYESVASIVIHEQRHLDNYDAYRELAMYGLFPLVYLAVDMLGEYLCNFIPFSFNGAIIPFIQKGISCAVASCTYRQSWPFIKLSVSRTMEWQADTAIMQSSIPTMQGYQDYCIKCRYIEDFFPQNRDNTYLSTLQQTHPTHTQRIARCNKELSKRLLQQKIL